MATRISLVDLPGLLADVVIDAFAPQLDVDIDVLPAGSPPQRILDGDPDVVFVGAVDPERYESAWLLLRQRPELGLFAISPDGRQAWIHELHPHARRIGELSASSLRVAVRAIVESRRT